MPTQTILAIRQETLANAQYRIRLTLKRPDQPVLEGEATMSFALTDQEQADLRWYLEEYLQRAQSTTDLQVDQIERLMRDRGEELYAKVLAANFDTQAIWFAVRERLADLRIEITTPIAEAAAIPWELLRDPQSASPLAVRVAAFVRVQSNPNLSFVQVTPPANGIMRLLYVVCRPGGAKDVALRAVANRLLHDLGDDLARFAITALRPPTFEQLQRELTDAKAAGRPYHIVHFDGHGTYADLSQGRLAGWLAHLSPLLLGGERGANRAICSLKRRAPKRGCAQCRGPSWASCSTTTTCPCSCSTPVNPPCTRRPPHRNRSRNRRLSLSKPKVEAGLARIGPLPLRQAQGPLRFRIRQQYHLMSTTKCAPLARWPRR